MRPLAQQAVSPSMYPQPIPLSPQVHCFCTAHSFQKTVAPCIADACDEGDQQLTEQYANGICSVVGVQLPSFKDLLAEAASTSETESTPATAPPPPQPNSTPCSSNGNFTVTSSTAATQSAGPGSASASPAAKSEARTVENHVLISAGLAIILGTGMFFF